MTTTQPPTTDAVPDSRVPAVAARLRLDIFERLEDMPLAELARVVRVTGPTLRRYIRGEVDPRAARRGIRQWHSTGSPQRPDVERSICSSSGTRGTVAPVTRHSAHAPTGAAYGGVCACWTPTMVARAAS